MLKKEVTVKDQFGTEYNIQATVDKSIVDLQDHSTKLKSASTPAETRSLKNLISSL